MIVEVLKKCTISIDKSDFLSLGPLPHPGRAGYGKREGVAALLVAYPAAIAGG